MLARREGIIGGSVPRGAAMTNPSTVFPVLTEMEIDQVVDPDHSYRVQRGSLGLEELQAVAAAQRDADWKRVKPLIEAMNLLALRANYAHYSGSWCSVPVKVWRIAVAALALLSIEEEGNATVKKEKEETDGTAKPRS